MQRLVKSKRLLRNKETWVKEIFQKRKNFSANDLLLNLMASLSVLEEGL